ncbi:MAG: EamA family transporter [Actinobacteria bacterium HGW-Actinobacteria-4]|nr:MAG: EamA family transporter [Actinobacteria bacterium HGW-Actinobacteria-4]
MAYTGVRPRHFALVVLAATLWGSGGVVGKVLGDHSGLHAMSVAMWRMAVGGLVLLGFLAVRRALTLRPLTRPMWVRILLTGGFTAVFEATYFSAINLSSVGLTTLIAIGSAPVMVAAFDWFALRTRPPRLTVIALVIALTGMVLLLGGSLDVGRSGMWGAALALVTGASFAGVSVVNRHQIPGLPPVLLTGTAFTAGALMLVPFALIAGIGAPADATGWGLVLLLGVVITAFAYIAYLSGLVTVPPFVATIVTLLEPLIAAVLGAIVLSERLGPLGIVGGIVLGAAVVMLRPQRDTPAPVRQPPTIVD